MTTSDCQTIEKWKDISVSEWGDWHWQLRNSIKNTGELNHLLSFFTDNRGDLCAETERVAIDSFPLSITPHVILALKQAILRDIRGAWDAFSATYIPNRAEVIQEGEYSNGRDCIGEELPNASPVPLITRFYQNRVLFRVASTCPAYCRFCFRRRIVGRADPCNDSEIEAGIQYIASDSTIHEVILSGGDPLTLSDERIATLLGRLRGIPHVRRVRFDTKALSVVPQRITPKLVETLRRFAPVFVVAHFCHPYELGPDTRVACETLANAGVPLAAHTPLLRGVNDQASTLVDLFESLLDCRVRPYYLIQFIPTRWSQHFRVPISESLRILEDLGRRCSGLAMPSYIVYLPDAGGKVPVVPPYLKGRNTDGWVFQNLEGRVITYPEPAEFRMDEK